MAGAVARSGRSRCAHIGALDEAHVDKQLAIDFAVVVDGHHMRFLQPPGGVSLGAVIRSRNAVGADLLRDISLSATTRSLTVSWASYTSPIPPRPSNRRKLIGPKP